MCVEGLRAIPLGCSDCYDKDNVPEAERSGLGGAGTGGRARAGARACRGQASSAQGASHSTGLRNGSLPQNNCPPNT